MSRASPRRQTFETAIIERYQRRESSVEEALIEMYLAGVSVRRVEDITEALWGTRVRDRGAWVLFLPRYSPDLNPIEKAFSKLKTPAQKGQSQNI